MPFPGTQVIPSAWSEHHRPVVAGSMTARVALYFPADEYSWPPVTPTTDDPVWEGVARIQAATSSSDAVPAETPVKTRPYLVTVPLGAFPAEIPLGEPGAYLVVTAAEDAAFVGRRLTIHDVQHGSLVWERDLICEYNLTENQG